MKLLLTSGATREPIDEVRFISNVSTGKTGAALADALAALGHEVLVLRGEGAAPPERARAGETFGSAADLLERLRSKLGSGEHDAVVMTAAVADYRPALVARGKLSSHPDTLSLRLVRTPKILPQLKAFSPRPLRVIGFKLTVGADASARAVAVGDQFSSGGVDAVVHNDLKEIRKAHLHPFAVYPSPIAKPIRCEGEPALATVLSQWLATPL